MVWQVAVDRAGCDGPRPGEGERRERVRVIQRGDLGDAIAETDRSGADEPQPSR
jgi:hypothetical protein